jgi:hypothetical protein
VDAKTFRVLHDFVRHAQNIHLACSNPQCPHTGVLDPLDTCRWFRLFRWPQALEAGALRHFRCSRCGARPSRVRPTGAAVTVVDFFPSTEDAWKRLHRRLRG